MFNIEKTPLTKEEVQNNRQIIETDLAVFKKKWVLLSLLFFAIGISVIIWFYLNRLGFFTLASLSAVVGALVLVLSGAITLVFTLSGAVARASILFVTASIGAASVFFFVFATASVGAASVIFVFAVASVGAVAVVEVTIVEKIRFYKQNLSDLLPISESDCPELLKQGQAYEEIKKYIKSVANLDRMPTHGEYIMLKKYSENYKPIKSQEIVEKENRIACEAICSGEI